MVSTSSTQGPGCESAAVLLPGKKGEETVTIDYTYDPLYRLTAADYSTGDFYHYAYDSVGNRLTASDQLSETSYQYDDANRLVDVNGVAYTWDAHGNLMNDGVNEYAYDSANRLTSVLSPSSSVNYSYNGLGDRLSQTVDGVPTNYTLDLNAGLTQVLSDGTNAYAYGLGRISQTNNSTAEYFLGDALGSVRQLVNTNAEVTMAKSYDPYGAVTQAGGASQSAYGYTGEAQDSVTNLLYLRARFYNPLEGRFQSRDTWGGDANQPMSSNFWNYVQSNPVNYTDPTGHERCWVAEYDYTGRADFAEKYISRHNVDELNTYTAAGIGVQCYGTDFYLSDKDNSGFGIGQITNNQASTAYGEKVGDDRGYGLLCWIKKNAGIDNGCECRTEQEMIDNYGDHFRDDYELEQPHDQKNPVWAVVYMQRRIQQVLEYCVDCTPTDKFIAAALGQNGPGMNPGDMGDLSIAGPNNDFRLKKGDSIEWEKYFEERIKKNPNQGEFDTRHQLDLFFGVAWNLHQRSPTGWYIPTRLDTSRIKKLIKG